MLYHRIENTRYRGVNLRGLLKDRIHGLPYALRALAENAARHSDNGIAVQMVLARDGQAVPFRPARLLLHDMLGIPALIDIMAIRNKLEEHGREVRLANTRFAPPNSSSVKGWKKKAWSFHYTGASSCANMPGTVKPGRSSTTSHTPI